MLQAHVQGGILPQLGIRPLQQLRLGEFAGAEQFGDLKRIPDVILSPFQLLPLPVFADGVGIHQPIG